MPPIPGPGHRHTVLGIDRTDDHRVFLVERYWPDAGLDAVHSLAKALAAAGAQVPGVHHLGSAFIPGEDSVFCWFTSAGEDDVAAVNVAAGLAFDRIVAAIWVDPRPDMGRDAAEQAVGEQHI